MHGSKTSARTKRDPWDFYPTPDDVTVALVEWLKMRAPLVEGENFLDPAAGDGALISAASLHLPGNWFGIEIDPTRAALSNAQCGDSRGLTWLNAHVLANPPFCYLDDFWPIGSEHRPDHVLQLGWRPCFRSKAGPAHKGSQDFMWSILAPNPVKTSTWERLDKPC